MSIDPASPCLSVPDLATLRKELEDYKLVCGEQRQEIENSRIRALNCTNHLESLEQLVQTLDMIAEHVPADDPMRAHVTTALVGFMGEKVIKARVSLKSESERIAEGYDA